jgi:hypothetical protein
LCTTAPENVFTRVRAMNRGLHWTNLGVVATTALLPFPTSVVSTAIEDGNRADSQVAVALIGALLCMSWWVFFHYLARQPELTEDHVDDSFFGKERHRAGHSPPSSWQRGDPPTDLPRAPVWRPSQHKRMRSASATAHVPQGDRVGGADLHTLPTGGTADRDDHWAQWSCPQSTLRAGAQASSAGGARRADR